MHYKAHAEVHKWLAEVNEQLTLGSYRDGRKRNVFFLERSK